MDDETKQEEAGQEEPKPKEGQSEAPKDGGGADEAKQDDAPKGATVNRRKHERDLEKLQKQIDDLTEEKFWGGGILTCTQTVVFFMPMRANNKKLKTTLVDEKMYRELGQLTKDKTIWKQNIPYVASLLKNQSPKITAKAMWLLGEMGLIYPQEIAPYIKEIASFIVSENDLLRERAANALGRIGRADYELIAPYFKELFTLAGDESPNVRLSFIWASENIATNTPEAYKNHISVFEKLLDDENTRVRMEAPEMFRVLGKRKPEYVSHCLDKLDALSKSDVDRVVRIHAKGAIKAISTHVSILA